MHKGAKKRTAKQERERIGGEVDIGAYSIESEKSPVLPCLDDLPSGYKPAVLGVGVDPSESNRSGSFFQLNHSVIYAKATQKGVEVMNIDDALKKHKWMKNYWWKVVKPEADQFTSRTKEKPTHGYFIRALPGAKVSYPIQSCLFLGKEGLAQNLHNVIIAEEGSELNIITGCAVAPRVKSGLHIGISEFYVKKGAKLNFTMVHNWAEDMHVRPRSAAIVEKDGVFISNYIILRPVKSLQMYPTAYLKGENSIVRFNSIIFAKGNSLIDVGSRTYLQAPGARSEILSRAIASDNSKVFARGHIIGEVPKTKSHLECRGMLLSDNAHIHAIPELEAKAEDVDLSHEAAVGKIAQEKIDYLMARGLDEQTAISVLIRGFLKVDLPGLPAQLRKEIDLAINRAARGF